MTVTINLPANNVVGPRLTITGGSDFIGPLAVGSGFLASITGPAGSGGELIHWQGFYRTQTPTFIFDPWNLTVPFVGSMAAPRSQTQQLKTNDPAATGESVHLQVQLEDPFGTVLDSNTVTTTWDATAGLADMLLQMNGTSGETQQAQLQFITDTVNTINGTVTAILSGITPVISYLGGTVSKTLGQLFSFISLDRITTVEVTSGPEAGPVNAHISSKLFGFIIHVTTVPGTSYVVGPGNDWYEPALARFSVTRGGDELYSEVIHVTQRMIYPAPGVWEIPFIQVAIDLPFTPPAYDVHLEFDVGAEGQLWIMTAP